MKVRPIAKVPGLALERGVQGGRKGTRADAEKTQRGEAESWQKLLHGMGSRVLS